MPLSEDQWDKGETDIISQLKSEILNILRSTKDAYNVKELMEALSKNDVNLPDEIEDSFKSHDDGRLLIDPPHHEVVLVQALKDLSNNGIIQIKKINNTQGMPVEYYKENN